MGGPPWRGKCGARVALNAKSRAEWYERAASLCRGEYLQNMYYEWVFPERRRLMQSHLSVSQELASRYLTTQSPRRAIEHIERAIPLAQPNEDLYCQGMRAYSALNDRTNISRLFAELRSLLESELGAGPLPETLRLYQDLIGRGKQGLENPDIMTLHQSVLAERQSTSQFLM